MADSSSSTTIRSSIPHQNNPFFASPPPTRGRGSGVFGVFMRILMFDLDTLRPDYLGCYGYHRNKSANIDGIAAEGGRFDHYHCANASCLPLRAAFVTGMYGIHSGVEDHGGTAADSRKYGSERGFQNQDDVNNFFHIFRKAGMYTVSVSPFAVRHSSFW